MAGVPGHEGPVMTNRRRILLLVAALALGAVGAGAAPVDTTAGPLSGPTITFRKIFKSSYPEYVEIKISQSGTGTCDIRQLDEDASPETFQLGAPLVQRIFSLAAKLHNFQGVDLEVHKRLASLGQKTLRYQNGSEDYQVTFNYTLDPTGSELSSIFENISQQETDLSDLTRTMQYDRLGVNDVVQAIESHYDGHLLPEPTRFVAPLEQLAADTQYVDVARERARKLADRIRTESAQATQ
jgi:hypothetical protein